MFSKKKLRIFIYKGKQFQLLPNSGYYTRIYRNLVFVNVRNSSVVCYNTDIDGEFIKFNF